MRPTGRIPRQRKTTDRMMAAAPIPKTASSPAAQRPSPIADTSRTAHPTRKASVTTGAARNADGINWSRPCADPPEGERQRGRGVPINDLRDAPQLRDEVVPLHAQDSEGGLVLRPLLAEPPLDRERRWRNDRDIIPAGLHRDHGIQRGAILERGDQDDEAIAGEESSQHPCDVCERPLPARPHTGQVVQDPIQLLPTERRGHPIEDLPLHDEPDPVLRGEDVLRDPERRTDPVLNRIVSLRADERFAPRVDNDDDVAGPLPLVLVRIEAGAPSGRLPVDPANLVPPRGFPGGPEVRPPSPLSGRNPSEPVAGAPR